MKQLQLTQQQTTMLNLETAVDRSIECIKK